VQFTACPKCQRAVSEWQQDADIGVAGCPCGEVILIAKPFPVAVNARKPSMWRESFSAAGWSARLGAEFGDWHKVLAFMAFTVASSSVIGVFATAGNLSGLATFAVVASVGATVLSMANSKRNALLKDISFTLENGYFRICEGSTVLLNAALSDLEQFALGREDEGTGTKRVTIGVIQAVSKQGAPLGVPLRVRTNDAQYIADRLNEVLSAGGVAPNRGYRGEQVRIAEVGPNLRVASETDSDLDAAETAANSLRALPKVHRSE
jgi:hypothetical protein